MLAIYEMRVRACMFSSTGRSEAGNRMLGLEIPRRRMAKDHRMAGAEEPTYQTKTGNETEATR